MKLQRSVISITFYRQTCLKCSQKHNGIGVTIISAPEPKAHKVSLQYTNGPSSVRRHPHFQTLISLKPVGQSNFMCNITGVGERLHKDLGADWTKTLDSMATESPH